MLDTKSLHRALFLFSAPPVRRLVRDLRRAWKVPGPQRDLEEAEAKVQAEIRAEHAAKLLGQAQAL